MRKLLAMCLGMMLLTLITPPRGQAQYGWYQGEGGVVGNPGIAGLGGSVLGTGTSKGL